MQWYSEWRVDLGLPPPTQLGFAVIYGQDIINFASNPNANVEDLFVQIRAYHVRIIEKCHMLNGLNGCTDKTEENFLFSTTDSLFEDEVKTVVQAAFTEATYKNDYGPDERRPLILIGQGFHQDIKIVKKNYGVNIQETDIVDLVRTKYVVLEAGVVGETNKEGRKSLTEIFGLGSAKS